jgi:hypothetical protein
MAVLNALLLKAPFPFGDMRRQAYSFLQRFVRPESLWLVFLRSIGFGDFPADKKERGTKIFTALLKIHQEQNLLPGFFRATGRHFMSAK